VGFTITAPPSPTSDEVVALIRDENVFANYKTQELDEVGTITYVGQVKTTSEWFITRITDTSGDLQIDYANVSNNATRTNFTSAWTNRASLNYTVISNLTGL